MANSELSGAAAGNGLPAAPVLLAFAVSVFLAGANAVAVRFTVGELDPFWGAALRFAAAGAIFAAIAFLRRVPLPRGQTLVGVFIYGLLNFGLSFALIYFAIRELTASFTMVVLALAPLLTFSFAVLHRLEPFRWRALLGALISLAGIALAFAGQAAGGAPLWAVLFMAGGAACFAEATVVLKLLPPVSPLSANALGMAAATLFLAVLSLAAGEEWVLPQQAPTWTAILYLAIFGSVLLFYLVVYVIQHWTATASSYIVILAPFITVPLGALLAGETITAELLLGAILVLAGAYVGALTGATRQEAEVKASAP